MSKSCFVIVGFLMLRKYEELEETGFQLLESYQERTEFIRGIVLGLIYGIIGNFFVQHWYPIFEGLILGKFDALFWPNVVVCVFSLFIVFLATTMFYREMKKVEARKRGMSQILQNLRKLIETAKTKA